MSSPPTVFVCGATGTQGGAVARELLAAGASVHAVARDISTPKAKALEALGVKLWHGDFDNEAVLTAAIKGTNAMFLNFFPDFTDHSANLRQANLIMRIGKEAGVKHVAYSSGVAVDRKHEFTHYDPNSLVNIFLQSKVDIEHAVRDAGFPTYTLLRPGSFMANYIIPFAPRQYPGLVETGKWVAAQLPSTTLPLVDTKTIGVFSAAALLQPERFNGKTITYADEKMSNAEVLRKLSEATGRDLQLVPMAQEEIDAQKASNPFIGGQLLLTELERYVDMEEVKALGLPLSSFDEFLKREAEAVRATYSNSA